MAFHLEHQDALLQNNRPWAEQRVLWLKRKLQRNKGFNKDYAGFMAELIAKGYTRKVPPDLQKSSDVKWYMPHCGIYHLWYLTVKANTKVSRPMICCTIALMEQTLCLQSWRASDRRELHSWRLLNQCFLKSSCCWYYVCSLAMVAQWQSGKWPWRIPDGCALIWSCLLSNVPILPCAGQPKTPMGTSLRQLWAQLRTMFT